MTDWDRTAPIEVVPRRREQAARRAAQRERSRRRARRVGVVVLAVLLLVGGVVGGGMYLLGSLSSTPDFEGEGTGDVVAQVREGDSTTQIASMLTERGVVAGVAAFTEAAEREDRIRSVQPGYYLMRSRMSGASAVALLLDPASRVGQLEIRGGTQLNDSRAPDGVVVPGVLSLVSEASCATLQGERRCVPAEELRRAMAEADPGELGVPAWAVDDVARADPERRLEGLLVPGRYDVVPGAPARDVLRGLLAVSAARLEATGLESRAEAIGSTPYEVLTVASLVEKEAITADMPKVARVVYNRLGAGQRLEFDSAVNYPLDVNSLGTSAADRARPSPYNTYAVTGLPPTPIAAAGTDAIAAAETPEPGPWLFFVRCRTDGTSCFAETFAEHSENIQLARANGAF